MNEMFERVATRRVKNAVKAIQGLQNCFSKTYYDYNEADAEAILLELRENITHLDAIVKNKLLLEGLRKRPVKQPVPAQAPAPAKAEPVKTELIKIKGLGSADAGELNL